MRSFCWMLFILLTGLVSTQNSYAQAVQAAFDRTNEHMQNASYKKAISAYQTIYDGGYTSGALCLNTAIAYIELDSLGMAKSWLLQALAFEESREDATKALEFVEGKFGRRAAVLPELPWERLQKWQIASYGLSGIALFAGIGVLVPVLFVLLTLFAPAGYRKLSRYLSIVFGLIAVLLVVNLIYAQHMESRYQKAVTISIDHEVLSGYDEADCVVSTAHEGYTFRVDKQKSTAVQGWTYVRMSNGTMGWIRTKEIRLIP